MNTSTTPHSYDVDLLELYTTRFEKSEHEVSQLARIDLRLGNGRVAVFACIVATLAIAWRTNWAIAWLALIEAIVFLILVVKQDRIANHLELSRRRSRFYSSGLDRLRDEWAGKGQFGSQYASADHPYAADLDIFGEGSLYDLLCTCRTRPGSDTLAAWLLTPAMPEVVRARQEAVRELNARLDLRERIVLLGEDVRVSVHPEGLAVWGEMRDQAPANTARLVAAALSAANIVTAAMWITGHGFAALGVSVVLTVGFLRPHAASIAKTTKTVGRTSKAFEILALLLDAIDREPFESGLLISLKADIGGPGGVGATSHLKRFEQLVSGLEAALNPAFMPVANLLLLPFHFSAAIEIWRGCNGPRLRKWLRVAGEFEALCALASFAFENTRATYPCITSDGPQVAASSVAHPLIARKSRVANDISLSREKPLVILSGSNMSGKSTLLRTLGVNVVLALAGAPVLATEMTLSPLQIGASIRTQDSIQSGTSRFYAEIKRIRHIVDLASGDPPLLFLLDEILHGTNSHDRRIGAEAILRSLVRANACGIVTTHDLALAELSGDESLGAVNFHFEDTIVNGKMLFDYVLRPGVVTRSNAIALMRAIGLDI